MEGDRLRWKEPTLHKDFAYLRATPSPSVASRQLPPGETLIKSKFQRRGELRSPEKLEFAYFLAGEHSSPLRI